MGQEASQYLDCRFLRKDNSSEIRHQQLLTDLTLVQQQNEQKRVLSLKQRQKSINQSVNRMSQVVGAQSRANHDHILKYSEQSFPKSMQYESGGFIQIPQISLSDILQARLDTNQYLPANDIHGMFGGLLSAMSYLQLNNISHHDIYPSSIYYSNNRYKLANPITTQTSYQRTFNQKRFSYLSPELIQALINNVEIDDHTLLFKPDVYSLGMVMLEVCSLKSSSQCYDPETYDIVQVHIKNRLNLIQSKYGMSVSSLIRSMLEKDPKKRMSVVQIFQIFQNPRNNNNRISTVGKQAPISILKNAHKPPLPPPLPKQRISTQNIAPPQRMTRQYNVVVSPPPSIPQPDPDRLTFLNDPSRPPTFNPLARQDSLNFQQRQSTNESGPSVNLQQIDNRIDRILSNSRRY